jgi:beta-galactosidase
VVRRHADQASYLFVINHTGDLAEVPADGTDLVTGQTCAGIVRVPAGDVAVVREGVT